MGLGLGLKGQLGRCMGAWVVVYIHTIEISMFHTDVLFLLIKTYLAIQVYDIKKGKWILLIELKEAEIT